MDKIKTQVCWTINENVDLDNPIYRAIPMSALIKNDDSFVLTKNELKNIIWDAITEGYLNGSLSAVEYQKKKNEYINSIIQP